MVIGFGISTPEHAQTVRDAGAAGFIVGSQIVKTLDKDGLAGVRKLAESLAPQ
ncbi:MAG: tryptophan synthase subunit alpha [Candidatus Micrarchaeota archaeon]|nr:tryptophan synthase subunit alpha [Candidatus Micrarchaeota archaeon]